MSTATEITAGGASLATSSDDTAASSASTRRGFLERLGHGVAGAAAFLFLARCDHAGAGLGHEDEQDDDFGMHGPIRENHAVLQLPAEAAALGLFAPYDDGSPFLRRWAVAHVARGKRDQVVVLLVDTQTGGHAELELMALDPDIRPIASSERYGVFVDNGGRGDLPTPLHLRKLSERLAEILRDNEHSVDPGWRVPSLREAASLRAQPIRPARPPLGSAPGA